MCEFEQPPNLREHLTSSHRPTSYYYFWAIGVLCVLTTSILLIPRIRSFYKHAKQVRDQRDDPLLPFSYIAMLLFVSFPVMASCGKFITLLSPFAAYSVEFVMALMESIVLYSFTTLLIMYLGSTNLIVAFQSAPETKWRASPPIGCCLRPCTKPSTINKRDFQRLYYCICQYCLLLPCLDFVILVQGYGCNRYTVQALNAVKTASVLVCFYGLLALLKAAGTLLHEHGIHGKFWCIKGLLLFMLVPPVIMSFVEYVPETNEEYDHDTMVEAWSSVLSLVCLTGLSWVFLKYFKPEDALHAMLNAEKKDYTAAASRSQININRMEEKAAIIGDTETDANNDAQTSLVIETEQHT